MQTYVGVRREGVHFFLLLLHENLLQMRKLAIIELVNNIHEGCFFVNTEGGFSIGKEWEFFVFFVLCYTYKKTISEGVI